MKLQQKKNKVKFEITVSKGTYIRSIVEQLGKSLNTEKDADLFNHDNKKLEF